MSVTVTSSDQFRMTLVSMTSPAALAADLLAKHLPMDAPQAVQRLSKIPSVLADSVPAPLARHLKGLLAALGVHVLLEQPGGATGDPLLDVAIQYIDGPCPCAAERVGPLVGLPPESVATAMMGASGLVITRSTSEAVTLRRSLRRVTGVRVTFSRPEAALYDLFLRPGAMPSPALIQLLRQLGAEPCPFSGALAAALNGRMVALVAARHGAALTAVNRDFQRFDLYLSGYDGPSARELASFLATRLPLTGGGRIILDRQEPLRIETGLTRASARQFKADYAAIGLETRVRLANPGRSWAE